MVAVVYLGDALIDFLPETSGIDEVIYRPRLGGGAFNGAIALGRQGVPCSFPGPLGRDVFGTQLAEALSRNQVDTTLTQRVDRLTALALVSFRGADAAPEYNFYTAETAHRDLAPGDLPERLPESVQAVVFASIPLVEEPSARQIEAYVAAQKGRRLLIFDPNVRPLLVRDEQSYRARLDRLFALSDVIKLSLEDLAWIAPGEEPASFAQRWLSAGTCLVLVTQGDAGATAYTSATSASATAPVVEVVDTVGAGDTFLAAALAWAWRRNALSGTALAALPAEDLGDLLGQATHAAALTCTRAGCQPPWAAEFSVE
jgi:fructokinase